jgi:uncharacterized protein (TIGR02246 family)
MKFVVAMLFAALASVLPARSQNSDATALVASFMQAWNVADAKCLGALFAPDADLVTPTGVHSRGRAAIESFYASAFARGYAGSKGQGEIMHTRALSPDIALIDARFSITGARNQDGSTRRGESGILVAVIGRTSSGWQILALRENEGAADFTPYPPVH